VNNLEELMHDLVRSSIEVKKELYRRDEAASTTPEGTDGPRIEIHTCRLCDRSAAGKGAQVQHQSDCPLAKLQTAQRALREAWPELFLGKPASEKKASASGACTHLL
jgi:hypothetical protein